MARLIEFLFVGFLIYFAYRRMAAPLTRGYYERDREMHEEELLRNFKNKIVSPKIDRAHAKDADFKDLS